MIPHDRILPKAVEKTRSRDADYGLSRLTNAGLTEAWETMPIDALAEGARYKLSRAIQPSTSFAKRLDDIEDAYNYCAALYERTIKAEETSKQP